MSDEVAHIHIFDPQGEEWPSPLQIGLLTVVCLSIASVVIGVASYIVVSGIRQRRLQAAKELAEKEAYDRRMANWSNPGDPPKPLPPTSCLYGVFDMEAQRPVVEASAARAAVALTIGQGPGMGSDTASAPGSGQHRHLAARPSIEAGAGWNSPPMAAAASMSKDPVGGPPSPSGSLHASEPDYSQTAARLLSSGDSSAAEYGGPAAGNPASYTPPSYLAPPAFSDALLEGELLEAGPSTHDLAYGHPESSTIYFDVASGQSEISLGGSRLLAP
ncbi:hypothetical protein H696_04426 [Fonticula alba]|uniref:Uncharacterized protein n=1 Tax=Fonticula alba TaxID=691883 RepID=A0A058Z4H6_FONAL|nr:hypothetical protein H696_04426 [Fonticula alba]KCV69006.1 hypothetical protein H696_04426 [Fonticula alba]|eukprot:XP_009496577.1 hypothetical protein H696_04426 [Fonticula alba]